LLLTKLEGHPLESTPRTTAERSQHSDPVGIAPLWRGGQPTETVTSHKLHAPTRWRLIFVRPWRARAF